MGKPERLSPHCTSQQGDGGQAARVTCRQALVHLLLLIPKNLTPLRALRFSGTPLFFKGTPYYARRFHPFRKPRYRQIECAGAPNAVNFAERPLAGISQKRRFACASKLLKAASMRQIGCAYPKASFWNAQIFIKNIKLQTHGKSQRSEIFVNKAAEPRWEGAMPDRVL